MEVFKAESDHPEGTGVAFLCSVWGLPEDRGSISPTGVEYSRGQGYVSPNRLGPLRLGQH